LRQQPARGVRLEFLLQLVEPLGGTALVGIRLQLARRDEPLVAGEPPQRGA